MTTYTFSNALYDLTYGIYFDPANDTLDIEGPSSSVDIYVPLYYGYGQIDFSKASDRVLLQESTLLTVSLNLAVATSNFITTTGYIIIGDGTADESTDLSGAQAVGHVTLGNNFYGFDGSDTYTGGAAGDNFRTNDGNDWIFGGGGGDTVVAGDGSDYINTTTGPSGNDLLFGNKGFDFIVSGSGDDTIYGGTSSDHIQSGADNDLVYGNKHGDFINGGLGADTLYGGQGNDSIESEGFASSLIYGNLGDDSVSTSQGNDTVYGGQGADLIHGNSTLGGGQLIYGNRDNDTIYGGLGSDTIDGGPGDDTIYAVSDFYSGTPKGNSLVFGGAGNDSIRIDGDSQSAAYGGDGNDYLTGYTYLGSGANLYGGAGNDTIEYNTSHGYGEGGDDYISSHKLGIGGTGNDTIDGAETMAGGPGNDVLIAGYGDTSDMSGGADGDNFVWMDEKRLTNETFLDFSSVGTWTYSPGTDIVRDFQPGIDRLIFDIQGVFFYGMEFNGTAAFATGVVNSGGRLVIEETVLAAVPPGPVKLGGLIGTFVGTAGLAGYVSGLSGNGTLGLYHGFAANTKHTLLWIFQASDTAGDAGIDAVSVIYTLKVNGVTASDILLV